MPFKTVLADQQVRLKATQPVSDGTIAAEWMIPVNAAQNQLIRIDYAAFQWEGLGTWGMDAAGVSGALFLSKRGPEQAPLPSGAVSDEDLLLTYPLALWTETSGAAFAESKATLFPFKQTLVVQDKLYATVLTHNTGNTNTGHFLIGYTVGTLPTTEFLQQRVGDVC